MTDEPRYTRTRPEPWSPDLRGDETDPLASAVQQAIGTASMCWEHPAGAGEFDSSQAAWVADGLLAFLRAGADDTPCDPAAYPTAGQLWHQLLAATAEQRISRLAALIESAIDGNNCHMAGHRSAMSYAGWPEGEAHAHAHGWAEGYLAHSAIHGCPAGIEQGAEALKRYRPEAVAE